MRIATTFSAGFVVWSTCQEIPSPQNPLPRNIHHCHPIPKYDLFMLLSHKPFNITKHIPPSFSLLSYKSSIAFYTLLHPLSLSLLLSIIYNTAMQADISEKVGFSSWWTYLSSPLHTLSGRVVGLSEKVKKIGKDDPRRIFHSLKVGLALTLVSTVYYVNPLFNDFKVSAMWAVLTVVVVMEYTVGGTLGKGLNRAFATMLAGALGVGAHYIAAFAGEKGEPVVLAVFVFLLAAAATFCRFVPEIKKRYEYGVTIFILTFSLVSVSSYRASDVIQLAQQRLATIAIGVATCLCISIFVFPVWAGEDLHKQAAVNLERLASFLEGLGAGYFADTDVGVKLEDKSFLTCYKGVLNSKATEESLANFARWEPGHGRFRFRHPWNQYHKIGSMARRCAYSMDALTACITNCEKIQTPETEVGRKFRTACFEMSSESSKALTELATAIRTMTAPAAANQHLSTATAATDKVSTALLEDAGATAVPAIFHYATIASLLAQVVGCAQQTAAAVEELARLAGFHETDVKTVDEDEDPHVVIDVKD